MVRRHVALGARSLSYLEAGASALNSARSKGAVVLVHGFPLHAEMWEPQLASVPEGWTFLAPDLRGFGQSPAGPANGASIDDYAADVIDLMDALKITAAVIGGVSMGGYVTFGVFRRAPQYFSGMILADTRSQADTDEGRAARERMLALLEREGVSGVANDMMPKLLGRTTHAERPALVKRVREIILQNPPPAIGGAIRRMMTRPDSTSLLGRVLCPALVLVGEEDALTPVADARTLHKEMPESTLEVLPSAGHLSNLEAPAAFNATLHRFLDSRV